MDGTTDRSMENSVEQDPSTVHVESSSSKHAKEVEILHNSSEQVTVAETTSEPISEKDGIAENTQDQAEVFDVETTKRWPGWPGENVFRILIPSNKVGGLIGHKGEVVKKICEESKARIKVLHGPPGFSERTVLVSAKEEPDSPVSPAMDGLYRIHKLLIGLDGDDPNYSSKVVTRILTAGNQSRNLIGKQGVTVKKIQDATKTSVRIREEVLPFALPDDRVVEMHGPAEGVHKALQIVASHLRKYLVDRSILPYFEAIIPLPKSPPYQPWGNHHHSPVSNYGARDYDPGYEGAPYFPPHNQPATKYPYGEHSAEYPYRERVPHHGISAYGRDAVPSMGTPADKHVTHMQIPISYADAVIGASGSNISYIRRASSATVTIQESSAIPGDMTVEITGSATQVQTAQQLIQNFIAEATAASQSAPASMDYNPYSSYGSTYASRSDIVPPYAGRNGGLNYGGSYGY